MQVAFVPQRASRVNNAQKIQLSKVGFENGARFVRELRTKDVPAAEVGQKVALESLKKGDVVKVTSRSRGRGFSGVVERWGFNGGQRRTGSGFHRRAGSVGNRTWPGRVIPGKHMAGHLGDETITVKNHKSDRRDPRGERRFGEGGRTWPPQFSGSSDEGEMIRATVDVLSWDKKKVGSVELSKDVFETPVKKGNSTNGDALAIGQSPTRVRTRQKLAPK